MDANGVVRCVHGETAMIRTSQTSSNPNRYVQNGFKFRRLTLVAQRVLHLLEIDPERKV